MIDGKLFRDALISGANNIEKNRKKVDALNVFPVPDGDTGTNMSMTFGAAKREIELLDDNISVEETAKKTSGALLRGARGNSGVILSLLFRGMSKGFGGVVDAQAKDLVKALNEGVEAAYKAVMKPTEGTILTVARVGAEKAEEKFLENPEIAIIDLWDVMLEGAQKALEETPEMLPVLKKAGVVDAGGKGLVLIYEGMSQVFHGGEMVQGDEPEVTVEDFEVAIEHDAAGEFDGEITFTYCTEFIVVKDPQKASALSLRAYLEAMGDSVVVVEDDDIIKVHVHTDHPGKAFEKGLEMGYLINMKVDNMREQHANKKRAMKASKKKHKKFDYAPVDPDKKYGFVAVAAGEGIETLFKDLAVDNIVSGGQTMNPSTDDILEAIQATPAQIVIVLPNNKNIIMAAEQAEKIADRKVYVLPTTSIPQGLTAMLAFDPELELAENQMNMVGAIETVGTGLVTFAARDSNMDGHKIKQGEVLALENGKLAFSEKELDRTVVRLVRSLVNRESSFITMMYGNGVTQEEAEAIEAAVKEKLPEHVEVALVDGGQPVYYFIISVE